MKRYSESEFQHERDGRLTAEQEYRKAERRAEQAEADLAVADEAFNHAEANAYREKTRAEQAEAAQRNLEEREEKLEEALEQAETALENAHSRLETIYESRDPERMTQEAYFGMLEADRLLELLAPPKEKQPYTEDDHEGGFVQ